MPFLSKGPLPKPYLSKYYIQCSRKPNCDLGTANNAYILKLLNATAVLTADTYSPA